MRKLVIDEKVIMTWETQNGVIVLSRNPLGKKFEPYNLGKASDGSFVYDIPNEAKDDMISYIKGAGFRVISYNE